MRKKWIPKWRWTKKTQKKDSKIRILTLILIRIKDPKESHARDVSTTPCCRDPNPKISPALASLEPSTNVNFSKNIFFFIDGYDACGSVWLLRKSRNGKKFLGFLFCAVFAHSVQNLMGFCFWIGRLGCYFLGNQKVKSCLILMVLISFSCSLMMI